MPNSQLLLDDISARAAEIGPGAIDLSLDRMRSLLSVLGDPQDQLSNVVHVAGTNGKGSTIAFLKAFLEASGARVHCYTSPWLTGVHESIQVAEPGGAQPISEDRLSSVLKRVLEAMREVPVTRFEAETAAAFLAFSQTPADFVLLETGLGGRLDATNVVSKPVLTLITPIAMDHQEFLGQTIADIAREKAGILKPRVPALIGRQPDDAYGVIERYAHELDLPLRAAGRDWDAYEQHGRLVFQDDVHLRDLALPALAGRYQLENAGLAIAAALALSERAPDFSVTDENLEAGLGTVTWPGRLQRVSSRFFSETLSAGSEIWLDGGHNEAAAEAVAHALSDMEEAVPMPLYLIVGMLASKDADTFLRPFRGLVRMVLSVPVDVRGHATGPALDADVIAGAAQASGMEACVMSSVEDALVLVGRREEKTVRVLICGSLHLAGHVLRSMEEAPL